MFKIFFDTPLYMVALIPASIKSRTRITNKAIRVSEPPQNIALSELELFSHYHPGNGGLLPRFTSIEDGCLRPALFMDHQDAVDESKRISNILGLDSPEATRQVCVVSVQ